MSREPYEYAFEPDGMLRDIYVFDTDMRDWQRTIEYLRIGPYSLDGEFPTLPASAVRSGSRRDRALVAVLASQSNA